MKLILYKNICRPPSDRGVGFYFILFYFILFCYYYYFSGHPKNESFLGSQTRRKVKEEQLVGELFWVVRWDGKKRGQKASWGNREDNG